MIEILHYLEDPKLWEIWELWYVPVMGIAGVIPSSVGFRSLQRPSSGLALQLTLFSRVW